MTEHTFKELRELIPVNSIWKNNETQRLHIVTDLGVNVTNGDDNGSVMVSYFDERRDFKYYREASDFLTSFVQSGPAEFVATLTYAQIHRHGYAQLLRAFDADFGDMSTDNLSHYSTLYFIDAVRRMVNCDIVPVHNPNSDVIRIALGDSRFFVIHLKERTITIVTTTPAETQRIAAAVVNSNISFNTTIAYRSWK